MKIVRVQYTAKPEFVAKNKENIGAVMADLRKINHAGIKYGTYLSPDERSFMHFAQFDNDEAEKVLNNLEAFQHFQAELKANGLDAAPKAEMMSLVASNYDIFPTD